MKLPHRFACIFLLLISVLSIPLGLRAQVDPDIEWKEIETNDTHWIFDAKHQELAEYFIMQFERAKAEVLPVFKEPSRKLTVVLVDNTDIANGSAQVSPYPVISLYTVQPSFYSSIGEFKDYVHELLVHEYTHILNMEPVHGWMSPFYWLFGSIAHPNMILPRWYTEGLAVYTESKISQKGGRLNSQYLQGLARSLTLEKKWTDYPLSDLNDYQFDWLGSSRAYLFGGILWDSITREKGDEVIYDFNQSYSRRIPYFLDGVIETHVGNNYQQQLKKAYDFWQMRAQKQIDTIAKSPQMTGEMITREGQGFFVTPKISSDGLWMAYINNGMDGIGNIYITLRHPKLGFKGYKPKKVVSLSHSNNLSWHPASTGFVYEQLAPWRFYNQFYDLYFYDLRSKTSQRLTQGQRAHTPCFSPLGKTLYFISNTGHSKKIMAMDWLSRKTKSIYESSIGDNIRNLSCASDNKLFFVEHIAGQEPTLVEFDVQQGKKENYFNEMPIHYASLTDNGLLVSSPASGVDNLYLIDQNKKARAITNSLTRVLQGELDPLDDSLYFSQLTAEGAKLYHLKGAQWESLPDRPPQVENIVDYKSENKTNQNEKKPVKPIAKTQHKAESFSPWRYMLPNHWIPFLYVVPRGTIYQAMTSAGDPLGINNLSIIGQWSTLTQKAGGSLTYINNSLPVSMGVSLYDNYNYYYPTGGNLHFTNASALFAYPLKNFRNSQINFNWNYSQLVDYNSRLAIRQGPQVQFSYANTRARPGDISLSQGWRMQLGHKEYLADFSNQAYGETYAHFGSYWSSFTPHRHVLYLGVNGSYTPQLKSSFFSPTTLSGPFYSPQITNTVFLQRGYPTGGFLSFNGMINTNLEYRFPILDLFSGFTAPPVFFKTLQGGLVFDATTLDGAYSNSQLRSYQRAELGTWFTGYGLELESKTTIGFHVPISLVLGLYYGQNQQASGGFTTFFNVRL